MSETEAPRTPARPLEPPWRLLFRQFVPPKGESGEESPLGRLNAFSDGVFAIAITLLILDVHVPAAALLARQHSSLLHALGDEWSEFASYAVSFLLVGMIWVSHYKAFRSYIKGATPMLIVLNTIFLMFIAFIPFSTALLAEYMRHGHGSDLQTAALVYSAVLAMGGFMWIVMWLYASRIGRLLHPSLTTSMVRQLTFGYLVGPTVYLLSLLLVFVNVNLSIALYFVVAVLYAGGSTLGAW